MRKIATLLLILAVGTVSAEEAKDAVKKPKKEYRQTGTLASSSSTRNSKVDVWNDADPMSKEPQPIDGSITKISERLLKLKIFNNSKATVQTTVAVNQFNKRNIKIKRDVFSFNLLPKKGAQRNITALASTATTTMDLLGWKASGKFNEDDEDKEKEKKALEKKEEAKQEQILQPPPPRPTSSAPRRYRNIR